jgi:hypothetical protein
MSAELVVDHPVHLNNQGVVSVQNERYEEAIVLFTKALSLLKQELTVEKDLRIEGEETTTADDKDETSNASTSRRRVSLCDSSTECEAPFQLSEHGMLENIPFDGQPFVFRSAIRISRSHMSESSHSYVATSFIVLFNLALSHHLSAIQHNLSSVILNKALTLYELAHALQMREQLSMPIVFCLALVNNLGLVHKSMQHEESSRQCFEHLLATIMLITTSGQGSLLEQADGFLSNISQLLLKASAPAA